MTGNLKAAEHLHFKQNCSSNFQLCQQFVFVSFLFQHDNVPMHKARSVNIWFSQFGVEEFDWSAQSSDLNPTNTFGLNSNTDCEADLIANVSVGPH